MASSSKLAPRIIGMWNWLIEPTASLKSPELRHKARLLASLLLLLTVLDITLLPALNLATFPLTDADKHFTAILVNAVSFPLAYLLVRRGYPYTAGGIMMVYGTALLVALSLARETRHELPLYFLILLTLFASLFFSARAGLMVAAAHILVLLAVPLFSPLMTLPMMLAGPIMFYTVTSILAIGFSYYRDRLELTRQQQLAESEARFRAAVEGSLDAFYLYESIRDEQGEIVDFRIIDANGRSETQMGNPRSSYIGRTLREVLPELVNNGIYQKFIDVVETGNAYFEETRSVQPQQIIWFYYQAVRVGDGVAVLSRDITERKQAEEALRESENRYRIISETISDYAFSMRVEPDDIYIQEWITDSFKRLTGYTTEEIDSLSRSALYHPDDAELVLQHLEEMRQGKMITGEYRIITKAGEMRWIELTRWPEWDEQQQRVIRFYGVAQDITERKRAEQTLRERERLKIALESERDLSQIKNKLMMTISHEFRTPLATIQTSSDLIRRYFERMSPEQREAHAVTVQTQVQHLNEMLDDITFAVQNMGNLVAPKLERIDLVAACQKLITEMQYHLAPDQTLIFESDLASLEWTSDVKMVNRILRNLVTNAIRYSPNGGSICLRLDETKDGAVLRVDDRGIGISLEDQTQMFKPFFRGSNTSFTEGTGMGLSIVKDCALLLGGMVTVESELGKGSTFIIHLPRSANVPTAYGQTD